MIRITRFLYIHILVLPMIAISFLVGSPTTFFISYGVVLVHELCHLLAAVLLDVPVHSVSVMPFGMSLRLSPKLIQTPKKEILVAISGPLSNAWMLLTALFLPGRHNLNLMIFYVTNAALLALNLLPIPPLDGGRIFRAIMIHYRGLLPAARILRALSYILIILLAVTGVVVLMFFHGNISLLMIAAFLIYHTMEEKRNSDILTMGMLIYEKEMLRQDGFIPTKRVTLHENAPAKQVIRKLNFSSFYLVTVLDDTLSVRSVITESDIIRTVTEKGYTVTVGQCI